MRSFGYAQDDKMGCAIVGRGLAPAEKRICPPSHSERSDICLCGQAILCHRHSDMFATANARKRRAGGLLP